jgi:hypothetical protein
VVATIKKASNVAAKNPFCIMLMVYALRVWVKTKISHSDM